MDPSMIMYTEDSPHFHSAKDVVNALSASPWRSAARGAAECQASSAVSVPPPSLLKVGQL